MNQLVELRIQSLGLNVDAVLKPEALPALMALIQQHHAPESPPSGTFPHGRGAAWTTPDVPDLRRHRRRERMTRQHAPSGGGDAPNLSDSSRRVREELGSWQFDEALEQARPQTNPQLVVVLCGWWEAQSGQQSLSRHDFQRLLVQVGRLPPANPGRDMGLAVSQGWVAPVANNCVRLTEVGWQLLSQMLSLEGDDDSEAAGAPVPV